MSNINQSYNDRVRYILQNRHINSVVITEPIGWNDDDKEYDRDEKYNGIFVKLSNNLKFIDDGYDTIKFIYDVYGINEDIRLIKEGKNPKTDKWDRLYDGYLDLSTYRNENKQISIKFNSGGLESILKSRESEEVEISRETSLDGKVLDPIIENEVELEGRKILLQTSFEVKETTNIIEMFDSSNNGGNYGTNTPVPISLVNKSHEEAQSPIIGTELQDDSGLLRNGNGETGAMFFAVSNVDRVLKIKFKISFKTTITHYDDLDAFRYWFRMAKYNNGISYNFKEDIRFLESGDYSLINNGNFVFTFDDEVEVLAGESLSLEFCQFMAGTSGHDNGLKVKAYDIETEYFDIVEESYYEKSISKVLLPFEVADRLIEIYTGKKALVSNALGRTDIGYSSDGPASLIGLMHGFWIRGFNNTDEAFKPLTTSLEEFMESFNVTWNLGLGIEQKGMSETVRIEELSYFYNRNVTIKLPYQVKKVKRSVSTKHFFSSVEIGYEKGGNYEEAFGLDEYNGKSTFLTIFTRFKSLYTKLSKYRADGYGIEFCRRKPKSRYATQDTRYDTDKFLIDLKRGVTTIFNERKWADDFEIEPTGTFSPETANNLRLSPFNCLMRHGWEISAGLTKNLTEYLRYGSSTANSGLKTKFIGKPEYAENGDIINNELTRARYIPEIVEFEHEVTFEISKALNETSLIFGKEIPNMYGCIEFKNENGETEKGFLLNLKPNKEGKWKLLKVN